MARKNESGQWGEQLAAEYLQRKGCTILCANYRCRLGEIDLIALDGDCIVFVEVKTRKTARFGTPAEFVTKAKQLRLIATAEQYLSELGTERPARFDIIEIYAPQGTATAQPRLNHLIDAFCPGSEY